MREEVPLQAFVNGQTKVVPIFFAKKNMILTAFKIQSPPPRKSFYFTVVKK